MAARPARRSTVRGSAEVGAHPIDQSNKTGCPPAEVKALRASARAGEITHDKGGGARYGICVRQKTRARANCWLPRRVPRANVIPLFRRSPSEVDGGGVAATDDDADAFC